MGAWYTVTQVMERDDLHWHGSQCEIRSTSEHVRVYRRGTDEMLWHLDWEEIDEIAVWKQDLFTIDRVCMGFAWRGSDQLKRVDEEMVGWRELLVVIEQRLGISMDRWWSDVVHAAFAENYRVIWSRP